MKILFRRFAPLALIILLLISVMVIPAYAAECTVLDGYIKISDSSGNVSASGTTVTARAAGTKNNTATNYLTIKNNTSSAATIYFEWSAVGTKATGETTVVVDGVEDTTTDSDWETSLSTTLSGTFSKNIDAWGSIEVSVSSISGKYAANDVTLTLSDFSYTAVSSTYAVTVNHGSGGTVTIDGETVTSGTAYDVSPTTGATLVATANSGYTFLGWIEGENTLRTTSTSYTITPTANTSVTAVFEKSDGTGTAWFLVDDTYLTDNLTTASEKGTMIVLMNNGVLTGTHTIAAGDKLLIPFSSSDTGDFGAEPDNYIEQETIHATLEANSNSISAVCYAYRTLTLAADAKIDCYGSINVNGQRQEDGQSFTNVTMGAHGKLILGTENTGTPETDESKLATQLVIKNGGALYAYGYITGTGLVEVENGGTVHEIFQMASWNGGSNASTWLTNSSNAKKSETDPKDSLFMISEYHVQNIEAPLKVNYGATHNIEVLIQVTPVFLPTTVTRSTPFITTDASSTGLFLLGEGSHALRIYDASKDRMNYYLKGGSAKIGSITIDATEEVSINSEDYILPVTHNMTIVIDGAEASLDKKSALLPGAELIIGEGSTLTLTDQLYILDVKNYTSSHFFNRGGFATNTTPNHCPVPYVATRKGLSPKATAAVIGEISGTLGTTDSYYLNIKDITESAKLVVNGTLDISDSGAICTGSGTSTDKAVTGTGIIKNEGTPAEVTFLLGVTATGSISCENGMGDIAGVDGVLNPFGTTTYYGTGSANSNLWYTSKVKTEETCEVGAYYTYSAEGAEDYIEYITAEPALGHSWQEATLEAPKTCSVCGATEGDKLTAVAQIGSTQYTSLSAAYEELLEGDTIVILNASAFDEDVTFGKCCTIDASALDSFTVNVAGGYTAVDKSGGIWYVNTSLFDICASNLKAGDSLDLYFYIQASDLTEEPSAYTAKIVRYRQGVADAAVSISGSEWTAYGSEYYRFCYGDIAAKEMTDKLFITICKDGVKVSDTRMESVENYALRVLKSVADAETGSENAALRTTLVDMLCYGAECQDYFEDYNIANRADANISNYLEYASEDQTANNNASGDTDYVAGTSVSAKTSLVYTFYFYDTMVTSDMAAYVSYTNHSGAEVTLPVITGDAFSTTTSGCLGVNVTGLAVADGRQIITCVIKDSDNEDASTVTTVSGSVESYISTDKSNPALQKLMNFIVSAHAYFHHSGT